MARVAAPSALAALAALAALGAVACSIGALDGFSGGTTDVDAGPTDAAADGNPAGEAASEIVSGPSCKAIKEANPNAPDGRYRIVPANAAIAPFEAECDMLQDGGGWMRITEAMIPEEKMLSVTTVHTSDENDRFMLRVYANSRGCGEAPDDAYLAIIRDAPRWTQLRARYDFYGQSSCWHILGAKDGDDPFVPNMVPFDASIDIARAMVKMGGAAGDAFDGDPGRCDDEPTNFWAQPTSTGRRSLVAIIRRGSPDIPGGLGTVTSCTSVAPGATSETYWEYRDIYVR